MKYSKTFIIALFLLGFAIISTFFLFNTGLSQPSSFQSNQNIFSIYKEISGYSADTLGVVPDGHMLVLTDLSIYNNDLGIKLWSDSHLKLNTFQNPNPNPININYTTGIPFHSGETIWVTNLGINPIYLTVNGYYQ